MIRTLEWHFPLHRTHTGIPLGNGRTGLIIWGSGSALRITVGRADVWDHRGGMSWTSRQNYRDIRSCLEAGDEAGIREIFRPETEGVSGQPARPSVLPLGRIDLELAPGWTVTRGELDLAAGIARIIFTCGPAQREIEVGLHPERDEAWLRGVDDEVDIRAVTSWDIMGERLSALSFTPPVPVRGADDAGDGGWFWELPADPGVWVRWRRMPQGTVAIGLGRALDPQIASADARTALSGFDLHRAEQETLGWWRRYWSSAASVDLPNPLLQEIHDYGLYLFAGLTNPAGIAATLQGPWIEEYDFPPWSSDYHFNINVQMCYSPAYRSGLLEHLRPLFDLVWSWREQLQRNARHFIGVEDGYMLPHAVDDRCTCMGSFWTGTIDHACTAWVAQMMYDYADYTGDCDFLRDVAFPFMRGAFVVYHAMLEDDGGKLRLPVSVSPEYRGAAMNAWGANASFQLAAVHRLCENLTSAASQLGLPAEPVWAEVGERLPRACVDESSQRIMLWEGVDLEESHRHHSHLASIVPFDTIDPHAEQWRDIAERSLRHWVGRGMGLWSGWCMSWASQLHSRVHNGEGAELILELWRRVFTNEGRGSMHDTVLNGITLMGASPFLVPATSGRRVERMQTDGAMGGVAAVQEMLLYAQRGVLFVFPAIPASWPRTSFSRMRAPGGLIVSGWYEGPETWRIEVEATREVEARLALPSHRYRMGAAEVDARPLTRRLSAGERLVLTAAGP